MPQPDGSGDTFVNREYIRIVDPPHHLRYDTAEEMEGIFTIRDQYISETGSGPLRVLHDGHLRGEHADLVMETNGDWVKAGFDSVAYALKARAEELVAR